MCGVPLEFRLSLEEIRLLDESGNSFEWMNVFSSSLKRGFKVLKEFAGPSGT